MRPVNQPFGSAHTNAKLTPFPRLLFAAPAHDGRRHTGSHGNAELTRARHQAATTAVPPSPAQHLRSPTAAATPAAAGQPRHPIRRPRHSTVYLRSSHKKAEHGLRPMQVCSSPLPVLRFIADPMLCLPSSKEPQGSLQPYPRCRQGTILHYLSIFTAI